MEAPTSGAGFQLDMELPGSDDDEAGSTRARSRSNRSVSTDVTLREADVDGRSRPRARARVERLFRSPKGRRQPVAIDEEWSSPKQPFVETRKVPVDPAVSKEDDDMGQGIYKGERTFMAAYNFYISQSNALTANGLRPFIMPVRACIEPATKQRIAEWDMDKDPEDVTEDEWIAWFMLAYQVDPRALDSLKKRIKAAVVFDMSITDADSHIGRMLDGMSGPYAATVKIG
ncbi:hypothetical protein H310_01655 [Aphanomyces invadans]|uniref:Uncharacterized protein n=1 Tax=Aphanomyces invadans TaxID=157072 RepID=A0A024US05_9STRA|nr:hypothetical protein H310_01655 [Aphanomyces invadans]ETW09256.1 hypothetical protein H310_01655 [Aphanomyces invadans]|eukprot:XP_008863061.1 hypothetical protein H310_01655 [Aphanomyces invadans]